MTLQLYGELTIAVDATQVVDDVVAPVPPTDVVITELFAGGGSSILWLLSYKADRQAPTSLAPRLLLNGIPQAVAFDTPTPTCPCYAIVSLSASIDALVTGTAPPPQGGDVLALTYAFSTPAYVRLEDPSPVQAYGAVANLGVFSNVASSASGLTIAQALALARGQLNQYSTPFTKIDATLEEDYQGLGLKKGQVLTFSSNRLGLVGLQGLITAPEHMGTKGYDQQRLHLTVEF